MASKSAQQEPERAEVVEEMLDVLDTTLDRVKVLYEQYFLGIQKQPPTYLHTDVERKLRDLAQMQIRNTALRYRFATLQQKFGSYNSYWRRTLRQIENGTYMRNLSKIGRQAARTGAAVPEEILAAMPKRMREQVKRDREAALAVARLREKPPSEPDLLTVADEDVDVDLDDLEPAAVISEPSELRDALTTGRPHRLDESDADFDLDAFFKAVTTEDEPPSIESVRQAVSSAAVASSPPPPTPRPTGHARPSTLSGSPVAGIPDELRLPGSGRTRSVGDPDPEPWGDAPPRARTEPPSDASPTARPEPVRAEPVRAEPPPAEPPLAEPPLAEPSLAEPPLAEPPPSTSPAPRPPLPSIRQTSTQAMPRTSGAIPSVIKPPVAPSQATRSIPVIPGAAASRTPAAVESMSGPFPRIPSIPSLPSSLRGATGAAPTTTATAPATTTTPAAPTATAATAATAPAATAATAPAATTATTTTADRPASPDPAPPVPTPASERPAAPPPDRVSVTMRAPTMRRAVTADASPSERPPVRPPPEHLSPSERRAPEPRTGPPPGMTDADVNALYAKYVKAKEILGEQPDPGAYGKLLKTLNAQAPKIMEQYKARGVEFSVVVKDNQVIIRAKPKP